ncbi:hypothetical protein ACLOJK_041434 [Asimina triloba]
MAVWVDPLQHLSDFWVLGVFTKFFLLKWLSCCSTEGPLLDCPDLIRSFAAWNGFCLDSALKPAGLFGCGWPRRTRKLPVGRWVLNQQDLMVVDVRCCVRKALPNSGREAVRWEDAAQVAALDCHDCWWVPILGVDINWVTVTIGSAINSSGHDLLSVGRNGCPDRAWRCRPDVELTPMVGLLGGLWMLPGDLKVCRSATRLVDPCCWIWVNTVLPDGVGEVARTRTLVSADAVQSRWVGHR